MSKLLKAIIPAPLRRWLRSQQDAYNKKRAMQQNHAMKALYETFAQKYTGKDWQITPPAPKNRAIVISVCESPILLVELIFAKTLQHQGIEPVIVAPKFSWARKFYQDWGMNNFIEWEDFFPTTTPPVESIAPDISKLDLEDMLGLQYKDANVGMHAISLVMRKRRKGFDINDQEMYDLFTKSLPQSMMYAEAARGMLDKFSPQCVLFNERGYLPNGPLFDLAIKDNRDVLQWVGSHKNNAFTLMRYEPSIPMTSPYGFSQKTWEYAKAMPWDENKANEVHQELYNCYNSGEWFSEVGTQQNTKVMNRDNLIKKLNLDPNKKTAVLFAHLFWDATFFYGTDLFRDYQEWFIETIRVALETPDVNWLIKVHPANTVKNRREGVEEDPAETQVLREHFKNLPPHIQLVPHTTNISTYSLYSIMDYCLTVRGTVGIEAAMFGIPVITAGTGRYSGLGFTIDSNSVDEYLTTLRSLSAIGSLSDKQKELALRYAYTAFVLRPYRLQHFEAGFGSDELASPYCDIHASSISELLAAPDIQNFATWVTDPGQGDYLEPTLLEDNPKASP